VWQQEWGAVGRQDGAFSMRGPLLQQQLEHLGRPRVAARAARCGLVASLRRVQQHAVHVHVHVHMCMCTCTCTCMCTCGACSRTQSSPHTTPSRTLKLAKARSSNSSSLSGCRPLGAHAPHTLVRVKVRARVRLSGQGWGRG
jgi:hypothetical protein